MKKFIVALLLLMSWSGIYGQFSGGGFYLNYDSAPSGSILLSQTIDDKSFKEECNVRFAEFRRVQTGMAWLGAAPGLLWPNLDMWGIELGGCLNYHSGSLIRDTSLNATSQIFDYYQIGEHLNIRSIGLGIHAHAGGVFYIGGDIDFGFSKLKSESLSSTDYAKDWGSYCIPQLQLGTCLPIIGGRSGADPKIYLKIYSNNSLVLYRFNKTDWIAPEREYKNFSNLRSSGVVNTIGFSISLFIQ